MLTSILKVSFLVIGMGMVSCGAPKGGGETKEPLQLEQLPLPDVTGNAGVHPSDAVMNDPQNPFVRTVISDANRWAITGWGEAADASPSRLSARFYVWATRLVIAKNGEAQYHTANALKALATHQGVDEERRALYREAAIRAYQSVLDNFKDALGYGDGFSYRLVPPSFYAIRDLGGTPQGRWIETKDAWGNLIVVEY